MSNRELQATWTYHSGTNHSYQSIRSGSHNLEWDNQPIPFKVYTTLEPIPLSRDFSPSDVPALDSIAAPPPPTNSRSVPDLKSLAHLLHFTAGITKQLAHPGGHMYFRAAACTGALYHIDLYLVCQNLSDLAAGVYHFGPHDYSLRRLRSGDYRWVLAEATDHEPAVTHAPVHIVCTSTYWRNSWKYQARTYRHCFWDNGTMLANLLAVASPLGIPASVVVGFADERVNQLLGLDSDREVALSIIPLGSIPGASPPAPPGVEPLSLETKPLSKREVDYPAIRAMHTASCLETRNEVETWRAPWSPPPPERPAGRLVPLRPLGGISVPPTPIETVISQRGSSRRFTGGSITFGQLSTLLRQATHTPPTDFLLPEGSMINEAYLIVNAVEELPRGAYVFHRGEDALELLKEGDFREQARYLDLEQDLAGDASVNVYLLADLNRVLERWGNRGYRAAQLEASITGGRLYLASYAQGIGATGLTFYDDDVTSFFSPHAEGKSVMFLTAVGRRAKRRQQ